MKSQKLSNLLNETSDSKFVNRNWNIVNDQSNANFCIGNKIIYSAEVIKYILYNFNDVYIPVRVILRLQEILQLK